MTLRQATLSPESAPGFVLTDKDFAAIAGHAQRHFGLHLHEGKRDLVYSRLVKRLRTLHLADFGSYCALLDDADNPEHQHMLSALTTNVTNFFREAHHFEMLRNEVLPPLLASARRGGKVRLWSAGCSSGQEPYSLAMTVLQMMPEASRYDVRILATDADRQILARAESGRYQDEGVEGLDPSLSGRFFSMVEGGAVAGSDLRSLVTFAPLNLMQDWPMRGPFDVIFCRNVAIYFDKPTQQRLWERFAQMLRNGGYLFIGHSERITGPAEKVLKGAGVTTYRRQGAPDSQSEGISEWV